MAKKIIEKAATEKVEYKSMPTGFIKCIVLKAYEDKVKGQELELIERRFKSLSLRGYVEQI